MKIALIEDDPTIKELVATALELADYAVLSWPDGASFLEWVASQQQEALFSLDALITDWWLPGGTGGSDVIEALRQIPALVITGTGGPEIASIRDHYPEIPILRKPFHIRDLLHQVEQLVARRREPV